MFSYGRCCSVVSPFVTKATLGLFNRDQKSYLIPYFCFQENVTWAQTRLIAFQRSLFILLYEYFTTNVDSCDCGIQLCMKVSQVSRCWSKSSVFSLLTDNIWQKADQDVLRGATATLTERTKCLANNLLSELCSCPSSCSFRDFCSNRVGRYR